MGAEVPIRTNDVDGYHWPITYAHDANGSVAQVTYPDGKEVAYRPDALGRPTKAGPYASDLRYEPDGSIEYFLLGNGVDYLAQENGRNIIDTFTYAKGSALLISQAFTYDANGNQTRVDDLVDDQRTKTFGYDELNRLTSAQADHLWGTETYTYDPLNNLRSLNSDGENRVYGYDALNHLSAIISNGLTAHSFDYDQRGNNTRKDAAQRLFDQANRLTQVVGMANYDYDASGRRVRKSTAGGTATYYVYGSAGKLLFQLDGLNGDATDYVYLGDKLLAEVRRGSGDPVINPPAWLAFDSNPNDGNYTVTWAGIPNAHFELQESGDDVNWSEVYSGTATSEAFVEKAAGGYFYRIRACSDTCTDWRESDELGVYPALPAVTVPSGVVAGNYTVRWTTPSSTVAFDVDEQVNGGTWSRLASNTAVTSIDRSNMASGSYVYRVSAKNAFGSRGWALSPTLTVLNPPTSAPVVSVPALSSTGSYTVSWTSVPDASYYLLQQQYNGGTPAQIYSGGALSHAVSGAANSGQYTYQVRACNVSGCGPWSAVQAVQVILPPSAPTNAHETMQGSIKVIYNRVVWDAMPTAVSYDVTLDGNPTVVYSGPDTTYVIGSATNPDEPDGIHTAFVRACNAGGCSAWTKVAPYTPPGPPTLSGPSVSSNGAFTLSWNSVSSMVDYYVLQEQINGGSWGTVYSGLNLSMGFSGKADGIYGYQIQSCIVNTCSGWRAITLTVAHPPATPPSISVPATSNGSLTESWSGVGGASSYSLEHQKNGGSWSGIYSGSATSHVVVEATSGTYAYRVKACNTGGCSGYATSSSVTVTIPPAAPDLTVPSSNSSGSYTVSWTAVSEATSYSLQEQVNGGGWTTIQTSSATSKAITGKANGTYGYHAMGCNGSVCGAWSAVKSLTVLYVPITPTGLSATIDKILETDLRPPRYTYSIHASWSASSTATSYDFQYCLTGGSCTTVHTTSTSAGAAPIQGASYTVNVRACNASGCSAWSAAVTPNVVTM